MVYEFRRSSDTLVDLEFCTPSLIGTPLVSLLYCCSCSTGYREGWDSGGYC